MARLRRMVSRTAFIGLWLIGPGAAHAQQPVADRETLAFDRPESWAMKYFTSVSLPTGMGLPDSLDAGKIEVAFEGGLVPQLSDDQRRVGFDGTKLEDVNKTPVIGRLRARIGLPATLSLELGYIPPVSVRGATPNIFSAAVGHPFVLSPSWRLGLRAYGQLGTLKADITCSAAEAAAGADLLRNPFLCEAPSNDALKQRLVGFEVTTGYGMGSWRPYVGVTVSHLDLQFQVDARYSGIVDHTLQTTNSNIVSMAAGVGYAPSARWRVVTELFYSPLSVVRPPRMSSQNDGLLNGRFLVSHRF
jgi:hypothetical protein